MTVARPARWPYLVLLAEVLGFWRAVLFSGRFAIPWDLQGYHQPLAWFVARSIARGELPLWNPYTYCGIPIYANLTTQLFYPPTLALLILSNWVDGGGHLLYILELQIVLHALLGGCLTFRLLRRLGTSAAGALVGGTVYQLGAYFATQAQHLGAIDAAAWMPLAWLAVIELAGGFRWRWMAALAAALALSFLAGFPAATAVVYASTLLLAALLAAFRRASWRIAFWCLLAFVWSALVSAVQLFPTMELNAWSVSALRFDFARSGGGVPLAALPSLFYPNHLGILHADASTWHSPWNATFIYLYCGIPALVFSTAALLRRRHPETLVFGSMALGSALWMLGDSTPVYRGVFQVLPNFLRSALYAEFAMCAFTLAVAVLAGLGAGRLLKSRSAAFQTAIVLLVALDLIVFSSSRLFNTSDLKRNPGIGYDNFEGYPEVPRRLRQLVYQSVPPWRIDTIDASINWAHGAPLFEIPTANGDDPFALFRYMQFRISFTGGERWGRYYEVRDPNSPLLKFLNVRYVISRVPLAMPGALIRREDLPGNVVYENPNPLPRFVLVGRVRPASDAAAALAILRGPDFDPRQEAVVEGVGEGVVKGGPPFPGATSAGQVRVVRYEPREIVLETDTPGPAFLATSETYYPGWRAQIDGRDESLYPTNVAFRGLPVPAGHHTLTMRFDPPILVWSALVSLVGLVSLGAGFMTGSSGRQPGKAPHIGH
jgi:hypothetical protein